MFSDGSSTLPTSTKRKPPSWAAFLLVIGGGEVEQIAVVNEAPVGLQSRDLSGGAQLSTASAADTAKRSTDDARKSKLKRSF